MQIPTAAVAAMHLFFAMAGVPSIGRSLPFAFAPGVRWNLSRSGRAPPR